VACVPVFLENLNKLKTLKMVGKLTENVGGGGKSRDLSCRGKFVFSRRLLIFPTLGRS